MNCESFGEMLAMGGHGLYVWLSYGVSLLVIAWNGWRLRAQRLRFFREARAQQQRAARAADTC